MADEDISRLLSEYQAYLELPEVKNNNTLGLFYELKLHQAKLEARNRELQDAERAMEAARQRYAALYEDAPIGYLTLDQQGVIQDVNLAGARLLGQSRSALRRTPLAAKLAPKDSKALQHHLQQTFSIGQHTLHDLQLRPAPHERAIIVQLDSMLDSHTQGEQHCLTSMVDISTRRRMETKLRDSHVQLSSLIAAAPVGIGMVSDGAFRWLSPSLLEMLGYSQQELLGRNPRLLQLGDAVFDRLGEAQELGPEQGGILEFETRLRRKDGNSLGVLLRSVPLLWTDSPSDLIFTVQDISERKQAHTHLSLAHNVLESSPEGIMLTDPELRIETVNPAFCKTSGYNQAEMVGRKPELLAAGQQEEDFAQSLLAILHREGEWEGEVWSRRKDGDIHLQWLAINEIRSVGGEVEHYVGLFSDIASQVHFRERLHRLAYYDALTELPNRSLLRDKFEALLPQARRHGNSLAILFLDLDHFKEVNDSQGHEAGDELLKQTARRLGSCVREADIVARLGGDEFIVLLTDIQRQDEIEVVAKKIIHTLEQPFLLNGTESSITVSIGITISPATGDDIDLLIKQADSAMYFAKNAGRNNYQFFQLAGTDDNDERFIMSTHLQRALDTDQLRIDFQPQVATHNGLVVGVEAMAQWQYPPMKPSSTEQSIHVAEQNGAVLPLSIWLIRQALILWQRHFASPAAGDAQRLSVKVPNVLLQQQDLCIRIGQLCAETAVPADRLQLVISESALTRDKKRMLNSCYELERLGVRIAIDGFGNGNASLHYLAKFPIHCIKLDRNFLEDVARDEKPRRLVKAIIEMSHSLDLEVIADGVETAAQLSLLEKMACDQVQGPVFGSPSNAGELGHWTLQHNSKGRHQAAVD